MAKKIRVSFDVYVNDEEANHFGIYLKDILESSTLPALSAELVPLTLETKKARVN